MAVSPDPDADGGSPQFQEAKLAIREAKDEIVANLIQKAKEGSYQHAKFLFDFAGLSSDAETESYEQEASLARLFLDQLCSEGITVPGYQPATAQSPEESV